MSERLGETPTPEGAPEVAPDPRETGFEVGRPRLGGLEFPVEFSELQTAILNAAADEVIPPGDGFPPTSTIGALAVRCGEYIKRRYDDIVSQKTTPSNADAPDF